MLGSPKVDDSKARRLDGALSGRKRQRTGLHHDVPGVWRALDDVLFVQVDEERQDLVSDDRMPRGDE